MASDKLIILWFLKSMFRLAIIRGGNVRVCDARMNASSKTFDAGAAIEFNENREGV